MDQAKPAPRGGGFQIVASAFGWAVGVGWLALGAGLAMAASGPKLRLLGVGFAALAVAILPPVTRWLRAKIPPLRPPAVPTVTVLVLAIVMLVATFPGQSPTDPEATAAAADEPAPSPSVQKAAVGPKVEIVAAGDVLRPAQDALNDGDIDRAIELFFGRSVSAERRARPDGKKLLAAIQKASDDQIGRSPAGDFIERVHDHWLPQIEAIPTTGPVTDEEIRNHRVFLEEVAARELKASRSLPASPELKKAQDQLAAALRAKQASAFPHWRRVYSERLDRVLWERNIDAAAVGSGRRTIRFTGGIFASNANIGVFQRGIAQDLKLLRFNRATYQWIPDAPGSAYRLTVPDDSDLGFWSGSQFENVP